MAIESADCINTKPSANGFHRRPFGTLSPKHVDDLARSGITKEQALAAGIYTETDAVKIGKILNWDGPADCLGACMVFTFQDARGNPIDVYEYARVKPDKPRTNKGKSVKYESPLHKPNRPYFPPDIADALANTSVPIIITEGEKKALKSTLEGHPAIGLVGVEGWSKPREREPKTGEALKDPYTGKLPDRALLPELEGMPWQGRPASIIYDSDANRKDEVQRAAKALAKALAAKGAIVKIPRLPDLPDGQKCGLDDFLVKHGAQTLGVLIDSAEPVQIKQKKEKSKEPSPAATLMQIGNEAELWHCPDGVAYPHVAGRHFRWCRTFLTILARLILSRKVRPVSRATPLRK